MKALSIFFLGLTMAFGAAAAGTGQAGPLVDCQMKDGSNQHMPVTMCVHQGGMQK
ncbi:hypothetical protein [Vibrio mexicanus]|uniref:hypothetical protein n=1 Tax=Vibrio mexicanus TaxID=1004326 RepID=UPI000ABD9DB0|nr:hypothetical protein [Vibrio mexicanus]